MYSTFSRGLVMHISGEGTIGIVLALVALAGGGAIMLWPSHTEIGCGLIAIAVLGLAALLYYHLCAKLKITWQPGQRNRMIALAGMIACGFGFVTFAIWYKFSDSESFATREAETIKPLSPLT
jgi:hypothetical protein